MRTYYHNHPRDFANECDVAIAGDDRERECLEGLGYERITIADLRKHIAWINAENDSWGSNRACARITWDNMLRAALRHTKAIIAAKQDC